jgi:hypothetical protein
MNGRTVLPAPSRPIIITENSSFLREYRSLISSFFHTVQRLLTLSEIREILSAGGTFLSQVQLKP